LSIRKDILHQANGKGRVHTASAASAAARAAGCSAGSKLPCSDGGTVCDDEVCFDSGVVFGGNFPPSDSSAYHLVDATTFPKGFDLETIMGRERTARARQVLHIDSRAAIANRPVGSDDVAVACWAGCGEN
jgi:hypothetical protein